MSAPETGTAGSAAAAGRPGAVAGGSPGPAADVLLPVLVRLGGLPVSAVPEPGEEVTGALEGLGEIDRRMDRVRDRLLDPLYELVPSLERPERRAVLHAKRRVFQGRPSGLPARTRGRLPDDVATLLAEWDDLVARRHEAYQGLEAAVDSDTQTARDVLAAGLDDPDYLRSVAVAAPALVTALTRRGRRLDDPRVLRTLYSLATRTALKTSPFSGLTTVSEAGRPARGRRRCTVALHLAHGILTAAARDLDAAGGLRLEAGPVRRDPEPMGERTDADVESPGGRGAGSLGMVAEHDYANGMIYRREEVIPARWLADARTRVGGARERPLPGDRADDARTRVGGAHDWPDDGRGRPSGGAAEAEPVGIAQALERVGGRDARLRLGRLLASGAVRPVAPWPRGGAPFPALAAALSDDQWRTWAKDLGRLAGLGRAVAAEEGPGRAEMITGAVRTAQRIFPDGELGARPGGLLYEDCESVGQWDDPLEEPSFRRDVETLAGLVEPWVARSHIYDLMVRRYVARYGSGGVCDDPLAFFMALAHAPDGDAVMVAAAMRDLSAGPDPDRAAMPGGVSASPRHLGAYLQPVAPRDGGLAVPADPAVPGGGAEDGGLTVVNAFTNGNGALQARFHRLLGEGYRERLARGIRTAWGVERVLEIQVSTDCNTAQALSCGVLPPLGLPGEPRSPGAVDLSSLRLVHDPRTDTLFLADARGPVGLAYLGLISQNRLGGYLSWLVLLSDPWARLAPMADHWTSRRRQMPGPLPAEATRLPRVVHGRLVTRRESWIFPAAQVTDLLDRDLAATLVRVAGLRERWGLPPEVYVHQHLAPGAEYDATFDEHKPRYVDLRSPVSLLALHGWIDPRAEHLSLIEALPARGALAGGAPSGGATALEYLIGLQWPKNEGSGR